MNAKKTAILGIIIVIMLQTAGWLSQAAEARVQIPRPTLVVYITEDPPLTKYRPTLSERIAHAELAKRGFRIQPSLRIPNLPDLLPRDVMGVWNADRVAEFRKHSNADILWMASVQYEVGKATGPYPVEGTMEIVVTAFSVDSGKSVFYDRIQDYPLKGGSTEEAVRRGLAETVPNMIARFDRDPRIRTWTPANRPPTWPPQVRTIPPPESPMAPVSPVSRQPESLRTPPAGPDDYTGVVIDADHLRIIPSYRTRLYTERGQPILPEGSRVTWTDRQRLAREEAGRRPLHVRALRSESGRIVLREQDARMLRRQPELLRRNPVTVVVRPPGR